MLDCFNEGFDDEESFAATCSQIPKVYLNFKDSEEIKIEEDHSASSISPKRRKFAEIDRSESELGLQFSVDDCSNSSLSGTKKKGESLRKTKEKSEVAMESDINC